MNMNLRRAVLIGVSTCTLLLAPHFVRAEPSAHSDAVPSTQERARGRAADRIGQLSNDEMEQVMQFMREHSPNRAVALEDLPEEGPLRRRVAPFMVARYRALQAVKDEDPTLYDLKLQQLEVEDELYGLLHPARTPAAREKLRERVREATKTLVELNLSEREHRIVRLRESLQREEQKLATDRGQTERLTEVRTNAFIRDGAAALRGDPLRRAVREEMRREGRPASGPVER